jgi:hypothetical protein
MYFSVAPFCGAMAKMAKNGLAENFNEIPLVLLREVKALLSVRSAGEGLIPLGEEQSRTRHFCV